MKTNIILVTAILFVNGLAYTQGYTVTDIDSNVYNTVIIGTQTWMTENLKTTKFNDSTAIPLVTDNTAWSNLTSPGHCWFDNDEASYKAIYGALYNWYSVNTGKLCPTGWHVPTDSEWKTLTDYLGGESVAGGKLKEAGTMHWVSPNIGATNESGFTALPGGLRFMWGRFEDAGFIAYWWSSTEINSGIARGRGMDFRESDVRSYIGGKDLGYSVRCLSNELSTNSSTNFMISTKKTKNLQIFPNPFSDYTTISFPNSNLDNYKMTIYDMMGRVLLKKEGIRENRVQLEGNNLNPGYYQIKLEGPKLFTGIIIVR